ncbi:hypothetical protein [Alishewanella phage vB_AspM_Slickus01]|nr:hypothetical protein [Alishewanella phage vB_AspM_Slicko01]WGH49843.1 hypothetical protein [Alishewanella phage vB_AspM_Slickus01]
MSNFVGVENLYNFEKISCVSMSIYEFKPDKMDFFLTRTFDWDEVTSMVYLFSIDTEVFHIPSGLYIMLCDEYGTVDCIMVDELIGRNMDVLVMNKDLQSPDCRSLTLIDAKSRKHYWPNSNNIIPLTSVSGKTVVLLSRIDQWKKTNDKTVYDFV